MTAQTLSIIATVVTAHFLALISPGPDFLLVVRSAFRNSRHRAMGVALGIALANGIYITLCIIGVGQLIAHSVWLMILLKLGGGIFLLYIAYQALKAKRSDYAYLNQTHATPHIPHTTPSFGKEFVLGMVSGLSNPKNIVFYLSLFSVVLTPEMGTGLALGLGLWVITLVFVWDAMIILVLSQQQIRQRFAKLAFYIDKLAAAFLGFMGWKLIQSAVQKQA